MVRIEKRILSPTAINTFLSCPRKFYLRNIRKLRSKPSIHLIRGQIVHSTIHDFYKNHPELPKEMPLQGVRRKLLELFQEKWEKAGASLSSLGLPEAQVQFYEDDSRRMLLNFSHWFCKNGLPFPEHSEARIFSRNLKLAGVIDAVLLKENKPILVDYKTSKHATITDDILRQAAIYAILYEDKYRVFPEAVWIHFLKVLDDPVAIKLDDELISEGRVLIGLIHDNTMSQDENEYPCTCGGYCEREFI